MIVTQNRLQLGAFSTSSCFWWKSCPPAVSQHATSVSPWTMTPPPTSGSLFSLPAPPPQTSAFVSEVTSVGNLPNPDQGSLTSKSPTALNWTMDSHQVDGDNLGDTLHVYLVSTLNMCLWNDLWSLWPGL